MRDIATNHHLDTLDRQADAAATAFGRAYPRAASKIFGLLARLDHVDEAIARANARLPAAKRLIPASARLRLRGDARAARALWSTTIADVPFTLPARRRA